MAYGHLVRLAYETQALLLGALTPHSVDVPSHVLRDRDMYVDDMIGMSEARLRGGAPDSFPVDNIKLDTPDGVRMFNAYMEQILTAQAVPHIPEGVEYTVRNVKTGRIYAGGTFCAPTLAQLRTETNDVVIAGQQASFTPVYLAKGATNITDLDVGSVQSHSQPGTTFQVASNFNALETTNAANDPAKFGITMVINDLTQGPYAVISAAPGFFARTYAPASNVLKKPKGAYSDWVWGAPGQPNIDLLSNVTDEIITKNGYITQFLKPDAEPLTVEKCKIGLHSGIQVVFGYKPDDSHHWLIDPDHAPHINQVFFTTLDVGQSGSPWTGKNSGPFAQNRVQPFVNICYEGCMRGALYCYKQEHINKNTHFVGNGKVVLTLMGGGVFGNKMEQILYAIAQQQDLIKKSGLQVQLMVFGVPYGWDAEKFVEALAHMSDYVAGKRLDKYAPADPNLVVQKNEPAVLTDVESDMDMRGGRPNAARSRIVEDYEAPSKKMSEEAKLTGYVIEAIEKGDLASVKQEVPSRVYPDAQSTNGHTLLAIAKNHTQQAIVDYLENVMNDLTGIVIQAIEENNLPFVKRYVPAKVSPLAKSRNGHTLLAIAKRREKDAIVSYLESVTPKN